MKLFLSFVIKEARHILRDRRTMLILFGMPVVLMLIFGFAITNDVKNVRTVVVTARMNDEMRAAVERLSQSEYFTIVATVATPAEAEQMIRHQKADMSITLGQSSSTGRPSWQIMVDGSDPNMAQQWTTYAQQVIANPEFSFVNTKMLFLISNLPFHNLLMVINMNCIIFKVHGLKHIEFANSLEVI